METQTFRYLSVVRPNDDVLYGINRNKRFTCFVKTPEQHIYFQMPLNDAMTEIRKIMNEIEVQNERFRLFYGIQMMLMDYVDEKLVPVAI